MSTTVQLKPEAPASTIEWAMWANEHVLITGYCLAMFSILTIVLRFSLWYIGIYGLVLALFIILVEYPRSGRVVKKSKARKFQEYPAALVSRLGPITRNYFVRFILYLLLSLPCLFLIATITPAISLVLGACIYGLAGLYHEGWKPVEPKIQETAVAMPSRPPPREPIYGSNF